MMKNRDFVLICPLCANALLQDEKIYRCINNHVFDKSKHGYVNLLLPNQKKTLQPGDSKEMVKSRLAFLKEGYYQPIVMALNSTIEKILEKRAFSQVQIADLGCGVGYYLSHLKHHLIPIYPDSSYWGIDISKEAIHCASLYDKSIGWVVGSSKQLPFASGSIDLCVSVFSPIYNEEVQRVLSKKGAAVVITPGTRHLIELRELLFDEIKPIDSTKFSKKTVGFFEASHSIPIHFFIELQTKEDIENLLKMTPFYWRSTQIKKEVLLSKTSLTVTIDVVISVLNQLI